MNAAGSAELRAAQKSLWLREALADDPAETAQLRESAHVDVCIVGGGYTGLWTALRLKELEPSVDVAVVEADVCGSGASGRNGGFVLSWWSKFITLKKLCGPEEAIRLGQASAQAIGQIGAFCREHGISAGYRRDGWLWAATNNAQLGSWSSTVEELDGFGIHPFVEVGPEEASRRTGSPVHLGGVLEASGAIVQPALLALGLRRVALKRGVKIFEHSPMTRLIRLRPRGGRLARWDVKTGDGSMTATAVVLAVNAWGVRLRQLRRHVLVVGSDIVATDKIPERLAEIGWTDSLCISDARLLVHYYRTTSDGRIVFGKGGGFLARGGRVGGRFDGDSSRRRAVESALRGAYPMLADVRPVDSWTGPIDRSRTGLPFFGELEGHPGVFFGIGYSGNGVGPSFLGGRILASLTLRADDEWAGCGLVGATPKRFPPEPIRFVGGSIVRAAIARTERAEDAGRPAGALSAKLVRLAPAGLVPTRRG